MYNTIYRRLYLSANYRLRTAFGGRLAGLVRPTSIALLLTTRCNARCVHCDIWKNVGKEQDALTLEQWRNVFSDLRRWLGPVPICITGGEALLQPDAPDIAAYASGLGFFVEFLTNGYWKDQRRIVALAHAKPARITISLDGIGPSHSAVRGREDFWDTTNQSIQTLRRLRKEEGLKYSIRLKTVIMAQNLEHVAEVAHFAGANGLDVLYQPVEQNYNTPDDPHWFEHAPTWPRDCEKAVATVDRLADLQRKGLPIVNSAGEFRAMRSYFLDPGGQGAAVQAHAAHERRAMCASLGNLQIQPNGDVLTCCKRPPIGNVRSQPIRALWEKRPRWWEGGCCLVPQQDVAQPTEVIDGAIREAEHDE
jgi:MoaA/NifB/PqqE/SkfB family radical SAM enzyme